MACESTTNGVSNFSRLTCGISKLAGKRSFHAGVALGAAGTGTLMVAIGYLHRRKRRSIWDNQAISTVKVGDKNLTQTGTRTNPKKIPGIASCSSPPVHHSILGPGWMQSGLPRPGSRANPRPIPSLAHKPPPEPVQSGAGEIQSVPTKLKPEAVWVLTRQGERAMAEDSFRVLRPDGCETGLAISAEMVRSPDGRVIKGDTWNITHTPSGATVEGSFSDPTEAQSLANKLVGLDWTGLRMPPDEMKKAVQIIDRHHRATGRDKP